MEGLIGLAIIAFIIYYKYKKGNGAISKMINNAPVLSPVEGSGGKYEVILENQTWRSFENFRIEVNLYDENGVNVENSSASVHNWGTGGKAKFIFYVSENFSNYRITDWKYW
ncbi:MAG: FxLYD domain-containing protein [Turicibacter sp.]|nr:FxLYD domain-containing protein [Turicibacter sp.]